MSDREIIDRLTEMVMQSREVIEIQSRVIDSTLKLLALHLSSEEMDALPVVDDINAAAEIYKEIRL